MSASAPLRFVVLQPGARLHYAVPALFAKAGMLECLYTDIHAPTHPAFAWLDRLPPRYLPRTIARLLGRRLPPELKGRVRSTPITALRDWVRAREKLTMFGVEAKLRAQILATGFNGANAFYTLSNADLELIREAKRRGLFVVYEQIINPHVGRILREERQRFPGIERQDPLAEVEDGIAKDEQVWGLADLVLAASTFVRDEILAHGIPAERVAVVPYGIPASWLTERPTPRPGRILFVGSVGLRKGNHYLAEASRILHARGVDHEVRVVGPCDPHAVARPEFAGPTYVGQVPRTRVREEFRQADIFAFPTLSDSFALSHLEALACGLPVITTPNCGSVVRHGEDGFIVPIRDATALADQIQRVIEDRALRDRMSSSARERAAEFVWDRYAKQLISVISDAAAG